MSTYSERDAAPQQQRVVVEEHHGPSRTAAAVRALLPLIIIAALLAVFIIQNDAETTVKFLSFERELRVAWALLISAVAGWIIGGLMLAVWRHRRNH